MPTSFLMLRVLRVCLALTLGFLCPPGWAAAPIEVVTSTSDLKSLVEFVGGALVRVTTLAPPTLNAEHFQPRPQDLQQLQRAKLVVRIGLDYDLWLDGLLRKSGRPELMRGPAYVDTSYGITLLEIRSATLDASSGHGHGGGNPHYWLDPNNVEIMSASILNGLRRVDPANTAQYEKNRADFVRRLRQQQTFWQTQLAPLAGMPFLAYHDSWAYLARRFRLHIVDIIEPKPGIAPNPARLAALLQTIETKQVRAILKQAYDADAFPVLLSRRSGAPVVVLAASVGSVPGTPDYFSMMEYNVKALRALVTK